MNRRKFIAISSLASLSFNPGNILFARDDRSSAGEFIMTVTGKLFEKELGFVLPHEHVVTDFIGAEKVDQPQYKQAEVFNKLMPLLKQVKGRGVNLMIECTPAYIGRDVRLLRNLSKASGVHIVTNTGYYAASNFKFLPKHAYTETSKNLATRWLMEWENGIEGTGIRPGFIKLGVNNGPLQPVEIKIVEAAALAHLKSGLKIGIHTGNNKAAYEELAILNRNGVDGKALIWIHAQNDKDDEARIKLAKGGVWISLDGVNPKDDTIARYSATIQRFKKEGLLHKLLISHDDGFAVNKDARGVNLSLYDNGNTIPYSSIFEKLKPALLKDGLSESDLLTLITKNPIEAFNVRKLPFKGS